MFVGEKVRELARTRSEETRKIADERKREGERMRKSGRRREKERKRKHFSMLTFPSICPAKWTVFECEPAFSALFAIVIEHRQRVRMMELEPKHAARR